MPDFNNTKRPRVSHRGTDRSGTTYAQNARSRARSSASDGTRGRHASPKNPQYSPSSQFETGAYAGSSGENGRGGTNSPLITRRRLLFGAAGVVAVGGIAAGVSAFTKSKNSQTEIPQLNIPASSVTNVSGYTEQDQDACVNLYSKAELPYGTLVWSNCSDVAACLVPTGSASPLTQVVLWSVASGNDITVLEQAIGTSKGFEIYDVRATDQAIIWTEANILQGAWNIYSAELNGFSMGEPVLMEEGSCSDWETPTIAAVGKYVFWQRLPNINGTYATDQSTLRKAIAGATSYKVVMTSTGRMATPPYALEDSIVATPRANTEGTCYQPTLLDAQTDQVLDTVLMPQNMKPAAVGYGQNGFTIAMSAIYNYGDGLSNLGSYTPAKKPASAWDYDSVPWATFTRQPTTAPCWSGSWFIVKSTSAVCGFDPTAKQNFVIETQNGSEEWGDFLATTGMCNRFVTYAHVDYNPLNPGKVDEEGKALGATEDPMYCTLVRAWQTNA